ncbi:polysaccharide deacetylase family protein [Rhodothalassium salexigens]|uniref:polysaccharide deacetylase family protein n=1 Tax=Rhodothalassium salexigens TaxID=1086 RepID=UPI00191355FE|nr:polysaccharide deacetylase family protein [Rhodothalassium salexigens]
MAVCDATTSSAADAPTVPGGTDAARGDRPLLCVVIDTEEEFDWSAPFDRASRGVTNIAHQDRAQALFARYGITPTYVIDHPVAATADAAATLKGYQDAGSALIGAHLHPWVNPPYDEAVTRRHSYPGNLPAALERAKLAVLTETIAKAFGHRPTIYKAGRYGLGPNTPAILADLGYEIDASVVPYTSFAADTGPDFTAEGPWVHGLAGAPGVMELPLSVGFAGALRGRGRALFPRLSGRRGMALRLPGIAARSGLLERIRLSPEGADADDHIRLVRALHHDGVRVFSYTYHSPSMVPGHTPYVRTPADLDRFLSEMERFFAFFFGGFGGVATTPPQVRALWRAGVLSDGAVPGDPTP